MINEAITMLNQDHFGLEGKERIIEILLFKRVKNSRIYSLFVGPPGVGKTSWKINCKAGRDFVRMF